MNAYKTHVRMLYSGNTTATGWWMDGGRSPKKNQRTTDAIIICNDVRQYNITCALLPGGGFVRNYPSAAYHFIVFANVLSCALFSSARPCFPCFHTAHYWPPTTIISNDMVHYSKHSCGNINIFNCYASSSLMVVGQLWT